MPLPRTLLLTPLLLCWVLGRPGPVSGQTPLDRAMAEFWNAGDSGAVQASIRKIEQTGPAFDTVLSRLGSGRTYSASVPRGRLSLEHRTSDGQRHHYTLIVPSTYDPAHRAPLWIFLHGGVNTEDRSLDREWDFERFHAPEGISLYPAAWRGAMWWHENQLENLLGILDELKRTYNIDENRVYVVGVSDGGTGAYFLAFRHPTPFAAIVALLGHPAVLTEARLGAGGQFYVSNLRNTPLYVVNGLLDPVYPALDVLPYLNLFRRAGVQMTLRLRQDSGHELTWWPQEEGAVAAFAHAHPRAPLPDTISWATSRPAVSGRAYWVMIDSLGSAQDESTLPVYDSITPLPPVPNLGIQVDPASTEGVRVLSVELGSVAGNAGLRAEDRIVEVNGAPTPTVKAFIEATRGIGWSDSLDLTVLRGLQQLEIPAFIGPRPAGEQRRSRLAFPHPLPGGRLELVREGNTVTVRTEHVRQFTLFLSPQQFDFHRPVRVVTNGRVAFDDLISPDLTTLLELAAADNDRSMLFGATLTIREPPADGSTRERSSARSGGPPSSP